MKKSKAWTLIYEVCSWWPAVVYLAFVVLGAAIGWGVDAHQKVAGAVIGGVVNAIVGFFGAMAIDIARIKWIRMEPSEPPKFLRAKPTPSELDGALTQAEERHG